VKWAGSLLGTVTLYGKICVKYDTTRDDFKSCQIR
ncbi:hypothetical protein PanWU01x14_361920, partial [Parasponia andersonii]